MASIEGGLNVLDSYFVRLSPHSVVEMAIFIPSNYKERTSTENFNFFIAHARSHFLFPFSCIIKRQKNLVDHVPGCLYVNETAISTTLDAALGNGVEICKAPPQFEHDPAQVFSTLLASQLKKFSEYCLDEIDIAFVSTTVDETCS